MGNKAPEEFKTAALADEFVEQKARSDDASLGNCGRGVRNILQSLGVPHLPRSETGMQNGHKWKGYLESEKMQEVGWEKVDLQATGWTPESSPPGVVWVYPHDTPRGTNGKGAQYGHVEIALNNGYAAGGIARNPGGSVRHNQPTAFVHEKLTDLMNGQDPVPENFARAAVQTAQVIKRDEETPLPADEKPTTTQIFADVAEHKPSHLDLKGIPIEKLIEIIINVMNGKDPLKPIERQDHNDDGPDLQTPEDANVIKVSAGAQVGSVSVEPGINT